MGEPNEEFAFYGQMDPDEDEQRDQFHDYYDED
jgi:hypothetical protein